MAPEYTETSSVGSMTDSNTPELITNAAISSTNVAEAGSVKSRAVSCETQPGDQHNDTWGMQPSTIVSYHGGSDDTSSTTSDAVHVDVMSNDAQTSLDGDTQIKSCPASNQAKMHACSDEQYDTVSPSSTGSCGSDALDEAVTDAPGQGSSGTSLFSRPPSPELSDEPIAIDVRFDDVCTPDEITQAPSSTNITTSLDVSQSPVQGDQNNDAMSEPDTSELDNRRASKSDFSPKSFASSTASTVASASSMSAPHEQSYGTSDEIMEIEPEMDSSVDIQPVAESQPHTHTDEFATSKVDFRTLNPSLRPQYRVDLPRSNQITRSSMGMAEWDTYIPTAETYTTGSASEPWNTDDMLDFKQTKSRVTELERDDPHSSTTCDRSPKRPQGPAKFEFFGSVNPHQDVDEMAQQTVPASRSRPSLTADTSSVPAKPFELVAVASAYPQFICVNIPLNNNNSCDAAEAEVMPGQYGADQTHNDNAHPFSLLRETGRRLHTYRPNLHTIAALVVEERNMTKGESTDSDPDGIDTSFIPQAVRQHAESQKKNRQAATQGNSQRGKKPKKSKKKKKTGRLNKERACVEKVLQPANEDVVDIPHTLYKPEEKIADSELPKDGCEQDFASKRSSKNKGTRRHRRQKKSQDVQIEQPVLATSMPVDEQTPEKHGFISGETGGVEDTEIEGCSCSESPADHCDEELNAKPLEDAFTMECAVTILEPPQDPSTNVLEAADDHVKSSVSDAGTETITHSTCHSAVEAAQNETNDDALNETPAPSEEDETMSTKGNLPVTVHDIITETTTDADTHDGDCHAAAAHEMIGQPSHLRKSTLTPILEEVEPETDASVNDAGVESYHLVTRLAASEPAALSSYREAMGSSTSPPSNVKAEDDMQLTQFVQQEPLQQRAIECYTDPAAYHEYPHPTQAYHHGSWPDYDAEPVPNYYHPMEPNGSYHYPFSNQLPEYYAPYYDYEPYSGYSQPQYFEPFYDQGCGFHNQLPLSRYEPNGYATPYRARISWQEWQPYAERYPGQPFGTRTHMKEQKNKPWYLQTLGYEEELEEEFETAEPTQRECTRRSCRKYGL